MNRDRAGDAALQEQAKDGGHFSNLTAPNGAHPLTRRRQAKPDQPRFGSGRHVRAFKPLTSMRA